MIHYMHYNNYYSVILYSFVGAVARGGAAYGQGLGLDVVRQYLACGGTETRVIDCPISNNVQIMCPHSRDAGVVCQPMLSRKLVRKIVASTR